MDYYIGQKDEFSKTITESDIYAFAGVSGDFNPVHVDCVKAAQTVFKKQIAHGLLSASLISTVIGTKMPGNGTIYLGQNLKFIKPVFIHDTLTAEVEITDIQDNKRATLKTQVFNQNFEMVIDGEATVILPNR